MDAGLGQFYFSFGSQYFSPKLVALRQESLPMDPIVGDGEPEVKE